MKKIFYTIVAILGICGTTACSDMLETDSSRQLFDPALDQKTDSVFYAYGIMQAMQQLADQYYFQNEMRGDLVRPTDKATTHLRNLSLFTADVTNKYDSVYLYYKVINNCNYYLAHRDTTLATGKQNVVCREYAGVASFRAWAYLQLTRQYGDVPYVTEPVTTIGQINANTARTSYRSILEGEAQALEALKARYSEDDLAVPTFGYASNEIRSIGRLNWGNRNDKYIAPRMCFIPLNVVLGDLYLELGEYLKAATCYYEYLRYTGNINKSDISVNYRKTIETSFSSYSPIFKNLTELPVDYAQSNLPASTWLSSFGENAYPGDVITYIPMAVNYTTGQTTDIPAAFGYDYYGTQNVSMVPKAFTNRISFDCPTNSKTIQVVPSQAYCDSARNALYYYYDGTSFGGRGVVKSAPLGDARAYIISQGDGADSAYVYTYKPSTGNIILYRNATVWLHLAEAINRMGYPDAAFAVLKNGIHSGLEQYRYYEVYLKDEDGNDVVDEDGNKVLDPNETQHNDTRYYYLTPESYELLTTVLPFLSAENTNSESGVFRNGITEAFVGIHSHGTGIINIGADDLYSPYRYDLVLGAKLADISDRFKLDLNPEEYTKADYINAMEDLLCDEYAMEFAFEGTRFSDLRRLALHKKAAGTYGSDFGDIWLNEKLKREDRRPLTVEDCYLPYK